MNLRVVGASSQCKDQQRSHWGNFLRSDQIIMASEGETFPRFADGWQLYIYSIDIQFTVLQYVVHSEMSSLDQCQFLPSVGFDEMNMHSARFEELGTDVLVTCAK